MGRWVANTLLLGLNRIHRSVSKPNKDKYPKGEKKSNLTSLLEKI